LKPAILDARRRREIFGSSRTCNALLDLRSGLNDIA